MSDHFSHIKKTHIYIGVIVGIIVFIMVLFVLYLAFNTTW